MADDSLAPKFHPQKSFPFPSRTFGAKAEKRSFRADWCEKYPWLHYDQVADSAFCYSCMKAQRENLFLASTKREPAFISKGYTNWKDAMTAFNKHISSKCHKISVEALSLPKQTGNIAEKLSTQHAQEKAANRAIFLKFLKNVRYLARQGLALRGHGDGANTNSMQLLRLRAFDCPQLLSWMEKKTNKYTSGDVQNECLQIMALHILGSISTSIARNGYLTSMADECTDVSNIEQFVICIRWVGEALVDHEDVIGLYNVGTIDADTLTATIRGQCVDGASNMTGSKNGVATQILAEESRSVLTHCYGHALSLEVGDAIKQSKICKDALDVAFEISKLIKYSPKRNAALDRIKVENAAVDDSVPSNNIRSFCPTWWTVRGYAIGSIIENYTVLKMLWDECLETRLDPDVKGRVIGVQTQMSKYNTLFGLLLCMNKLKITDNLSRTLQKQDMSAAEGQALAELTVNTINKMRTEECFDLFYAKFEQYRETTNTALPALPRKRKAPRRYEVGTSDGDHSSSVEDHYRKQYYQVLDAIINSISSRFDQPGYAVYRTLECLLVSAAYNSDYTSYFQEVTSFYREDSTSNVQFSISRKGHTARVSVKSSSFYTRPKDILQ